MPQKRLTLVKALHPSGPLTRLRLALRSWLRWLT